MFFSSTVKAQTPPVLKKMDSIQVSKSIDTTKVLKSSDSIEELVSYFYDSQDEKHWDWYQITDTNLDIVRLTEKQAHSY